MKTRGFTAIELLVTIGVIALFLALGAGVYFGLIRVHAVQAEAGAVCAVLTSARTTALDEGCETFVCVDSAQNRLYPFARRKVGVWHFEAIDDAPSRLPGSGRQAALVCGGAPRLADGKVGKAIALDGSIFLKCKMLRELAWVNIPTYDAREGFAAEAWVLPTETGPNTRTVLSRDGWFSLELRRDAPGEHFAVRAAAVTLNPDATAYVRRTATTLKIIRPNEWTHLRLSAHKLSVGVAVEIHGLAQVPASSSTEDATAPCPAEETVIGATAAGTDAFVGRIDQVIFSAYAVDDAYEVTKKLRLLGEALADDATIRFDPSGALSPVHAGATPCIRIQDYRQGVIEMESVISVGTMGALDVHTTARRP